MSMNRQMQDAWKRQRKSERVRRKNREQTIRHKAKLVADYKRKREETQ